MVHFKCECTQELPKEWKTYINSRFGFTINYPKDWQEGEEAVNGDGKSLYRVGMDEISVYGSLHSSNWIEKDDLIEQEDFVMSDGREATQTKFKDGKESGLIYVVFFEDKGKEFTFFAKISEDFFRKNEELLKNVAKSFKRIKGEEDE